MSEHIVELCFYRTRYRLHLYHDTLRQNFVSQLFREEASGPWRLTATSNLYSLIRGFEKDAEAGILPAFVVFEMEREEFTWAAQAGIVSQNVTGVCDACQGEQPVVVHIPLDVWQLDRAEIQTATRVLCCHCGWRYFYRKTWGKGFRKAAA